MICVDLCKKASSKATVVLGDALPADGPEISCASRAELAEGELEWSEGEGEAVMVAFLCRDSIDIDDVMHTDRPCLC